MSHPTTVSAHPVLRAGALDFRAEGLVSDVEDAVTRRRRAIPPLADELADNTPAAHSGAPVVDACELFPTRPRRNPTLCVPRRHL